MSGDWLYYVTSTGQLKRHPVLGSGSVRYRRDGQHGDQLGGQGRVPVDAAVDPGSERRADGGIHPVVRRAVVLLRRHRIDRQRRHGRLVLVELRGRNSGRLRCKPNHVFPSAGSYPVTLTVTDNDGATDDVAVNVVVAPIASTVTFRAAAKYEGNQTSKHEWALPASIQSGDTIVMAVSGHRAADPGDVLDTDQVPLPGWSEVANVSDDSGPTVIYTKTATAQDAGRTVSVVWRDGGGATYSVRTMVSMAVYSGVASVSPVVTGVEQSTKTVFAHTTPDVTVPGDGDWVVSYWSDVTGSTTSWEPPAGQVERVDGTSVVGTGDADRRASLRAPDRRRRSCALRVRVRV